MIGLHDLRYFRVAATSPSFRQAARALLITQPALTHAVQRLEAHVGRALFERRRTGVKLTLAGVRLLAQVDPLLGQWDALGQGLTDADQRLEGRVTLGCHSSIAQYTLPIVLPRLLERHPALDVRLVHDLSRNITDGVNSGAVDLGIVANPFAFPDLVIVQLLEDEVTFWARPKATAGVLLCDPNLGQTQWLLRKLAVKKPSPFRRVIESSNLEVIRSLAEAGAGTAILPTRVATLGTRSLRKVGRLAAPYVDRVCLVYRPGFTRTVLGRTVIDAVRALR